MSCNYAEGLSAYRDKGKLGLPEKFDDSLTVKSKVKELTNWIKQSNHVVLHTGAGISTSAGIPDFRGPKGVWTLEKKGEKPQINISFNEAIPTKTHMAISKLVETGYVKYVVSQNIDGLHLKSGLPRKYLSELHGNMFIEQCNQCQRQFVRSSATSSVGQKCLEKVCPTKKSNGRPCRGKLHDVVLDWKQNLPEKDLGLADFHSCLADLSICLGTTLQINPSGFLPLYTKKYSSGKLVICNLQPTKFDKRADMLIHTYVDDILTMLMEELGLELPEYDRKLDPTFPDSEDVPMEWTIPDSEVKQMRLMYEKKCCKGSKRKLKVDIKVESERSDESQIDDIKVKIVNDSKLKDHAQISSLVNQELNENSEEFFKKIPLSKCEDSVSIDIRSKEIENKESESKKVADSVFNVPNAISETVEEDKTTFDGKFSVKREIISF